MKKAILLIFLLMYILCPAAQAVAAAKPVPWQLKRRFSAWISASSSGTTAGFS